MQLKQIQREDKPQKVVVIASTNAGAEPGAVVVEFEHTVVA